MCLLYARYLEIAHHWLHIPRHLLRHISTVEWMFVLGVMLMTMRIRCSTWHFLAHLGMLQIRIIAIAKIRLAAYCTLVHGMHEALILLDLRILLILSVLLHISSSHHQIMVVKIPLLLLSL